MSLGSRPARFMPTRDDAPKSIMSGSLPPLNCKQVCRRPPLPNASPDPMKLSSIVLGPSRSPVALRSRPVQLRSPPNQIFVWRPAEHPAQQLEALFEIEARHHGRTRLHHRSPSRTRPLGGPSA